jgi:hypothetical protein
LHLTFIRLFTVIGWIHLTTSSTESEMGGDQSLILGCVNLSDDRTKLSMIDSKLEQ